MSYYKREPTVYPASNFNVTEDAKTLRAAMEILIIDEDTIIDILTARSNAQRQQIAKYFQETLERDLIDDLKREIGGSFKNVMVALVQPPEEYLCKQLYDTMDGAGTDETLIEILCSRNNEEIRQLVDCYERMFDRPLAEHMCGETSGDLRRLLTLIITGTRDDDSHVDRAKAREQAEELFAAGEGRFGTEESTFTKILAHENFAQLKEVFEQYKDVSGDTIEQALKSEIDGDYLDALLTIVECVQCPPYYFAKRLNKAMDGMRPEDNTLIRIIVSRSEIDLGTIKEEYEKLYDKTLESSLRVCGIVLNSCVITLCVLVDPK